MTNNKLIQTLALLSMVLWGSAVWGQDAGGLNNLLQDAKKASTTSAAAPAVTAPAPAPSAPAESNLSAPPLVTPKEIEANPADAKALALQEELRRKAMKQQALKEIEIGDAALKAGNYIEATKSYEVSLKHMPPMPGLEAAMASVSNKISEAYGLAAEQELKRHGDDKARAYAASALGFNKNEKHALRVNEKLDKQQIVKSTPLPLPKRPEMKQEKVDIMNKLVEGRQYFELKKYDEAEACFDKVLSVDPYNKDAMRFLLRVGEVRFDLSTTEREATVADMMNTVRDHWNPHIRKESALPKPVDNKAGSVEPSDVMRTRQKLQKLIIPQIEFRQANIADVLDYLSKASVEVDQEDKTGVNIILKLGAAAPAVTPPAAEGATPAAPEAAAAAPAAGGTPPITLTLRRVNLLDAIKYITDIAGLSYRVDKNVVFVTPRGVDASLLITRLYPVNPSLITAMQEKGSAAPAAGGAAAGGAAAGGAAAEAPKTDIRSFFEAAGVTFPQGTSIQYNGAISKLIVSHIPEAQEKIESLLAELDVATKQVEIEARFVDVNEDALEALGFQWSLTNPYTVASNNQYSDPSMNQRVQINANNATGGFTSGMRFFSMNSAQTVTRTTGGTQATSTNSTPLNLLTFASVLTNPELQMTIQALSQKGHTDTLSAPRVTTKNGEQATIKVVTEIRYPQAYEANQIQQSVINNNVAVQNTITVFTPADFQTRETGVILNVTPTIGPDGYTIDLTLVPEVSELIEWHQYGTEGGLNAAQPFFLTRTVTSKMVVWDGETVVLGGLIKESVTDYSDKIPVLGDIPLVGRLFSSKGHTGVKENLMIFVTARIVDSSGRPIHKKEKPTLTSRDTSKAQTEPVATP